MKKRSSGKAKSMSAPVRQRLAKRKLETLLSDVTLNRSFRRVAEIMHLWRKGCLEQLPDVVREHHERLLRDFVSLALDHHDRTPVAQRGNDSMKLGDLKFLSVRDNAAEMFMRYEHRWGYHDDIEELRRDLFRFLLANRVDEYLPRLHSAWKQLLSNAEDASTFVKANGGAAEAASMFVQLAGGPSRRHMDAVAAQVSAEGSRSRFNDLDTIETEKFDEQAHGEHRQARNLQARMEGLLRLGFPEGTRVSESPTLATPQWISQRTLAKERRTMPLWTEQDQLVDLNDVDVESH